MSEFVLTPENYKSYFSWNTFKNLNEASREELIRFSIEQGRGETIKEDRPFFEKVEQGIDAFREKKDEKIESVVHTIAETTQGFKGQKQ